jgi:hypothetical protein
VASKLVACYGTPRGGTSYANHLFNANGIRTFHEQQGPRGFVCGFAALGPRIRGRDMFNPADFTYKVGIHLLRHPLDVSETLGPIMASRYKSPPWGLVGDDQINALRAWVYIHERIGVVLEKGHSHVFCVRTGKVDDWVPVFNALGIKTIKLPSPDQHNSRQRRSPRVSWEKWRDRDQEFYERGLEITKKHQLRSFKDPKTTLPAM